MKKLSHTLLTLLLVMSAPGLAFAEADSCTNWMRQPNGTEWRTCVDSQGHQYCEEKSADGKSISRVSCGK